MGRAPRRLGPPSVLARRGAHGRSSTFRSRAITSCCFGGDDLRDLYVTTRREGLSDAEAAQQPLAGALLRLDVGVAGLRTDAFAG